MTLFNAFAAAAQKRADKIALCWGEQEFSYTDLLRHSEKIARELIEEYRIKPGDRIGLWLKSCPEFTTSLFGIVRAGAVAVPINNFIKTHEVKHIINDAGIDVLITDEELSEH